MLRRSLMLLPLGLIATRTALAEDVPSADVAEFQRIISAQISAFNADNGATAYGFAAPLIQKLYPTPDVFIGMVKKGYQPVYRQKSFSFGTAELLGPGIPMQRVTIVDANGKVWEAIYTFERQPDGTWRISGCTLLEAPGESA
jgi:Domain of unknown function (DUF4864)